MSAATVAAVVALPPTMASIWFWTTEKILMPFSPGQMNQGESAFI
ncbi:hypothetical protein [Rhizobium laguerreae]